MTFLLAKNSRIISAHLIARNREEDVNNPPGDTEQNLHGDTEKCDKIPTHSDTLVPKV
jgi:hypothetical protein